MTNGVNISLHLLDVIYTREQAVPTDLAFEPSTVRVKRQPDKDRLAHHMIFRHEAPEAGVCRVVAIVAHQPVVIHLEGISVGFLTVDVNLAVLHLKVVAFVGMDAAFVDRQIVQSQVDGFTFLRNPDRAVVVGSPSGKLVDRIQSACIIARHIGD